MGFWIAFLPKEQQIDVQFQRRQGVIRIGEFEEQFESSIEYWTPTHYESQWLQGIDRLCSNASKSCLITSITDPANANFLFWWPMYRTGEQVHVQNQVLFLSEIGANFDPCNPYPHIPDRVRTSEDGEPVSEWTTPLAEVVHARNVLCQRQSAAATNRAKVSSDDALRLLSEHISEIKRWFAVKSLSIFGSIARDEGLADSDVDVLVEFAGRPTFDNYMGLKLYLEALFGAPVDLAISSDMREKLRPQIKEEALHVT